MALRAGYEGIKRGLLDVLKQIALKFGDALAIKSIGEGLNLSSAGELSASSSGSDIIIVEHTDTTSGYAWLTPKDADGEPLDSAKYVLLSIVNKTDMTGSPPYPGSYECAVRASDGIYQAKLINTQTGGSVSDQTYTVTYILAYVERPAVSTSKKRGGKK
ncbi:hypothetical protein [Ruminococcus sp.]|uniref:hypothetical protein n=1 Tax=Ruminococcus sp. TaxID=41978 RepID=UPI001B3E537D|nr:hypothetical protein [Ruminococcus sp.]MBP5430868.1 hypothetical protein [Ruminococcus sp.]